jgi:hypothetical protein
MRVSKGRNNTRWHVEREGFNAIADRELVALGKFLDRWQEPRQETGSAPRSLRRALGTGRRRNLTSDQL